MLRWTGIGLAVLLALWLASRIPRTLTIFVIAAFIAFGVAPIVARLERRMRRSLAIALVYAALLILVVVLALLVVPATVAETQSLANTVPDFVQTVQTFAGRAEEVMRVRFGRTFVPPGVGDLQTYVSARLGTVVSVTIASLGTVVIGTFTALFVAISALVLSWFFLVQGESVADAAYAFLPAKRRPAARGFADEVAGVFGGYVAGQAVLCAIVGITISAGTAAVGFKYALLLGIVAGIAYAIPFFGMLVAHAVALVLAAPQGGWTILWTQAIVFTIGRVADALLVPKIMSESIGVSPIVVMFAVFAGGELFGLPGLLLGIPAAALVKIAWRFVVQSRAANQIVLPSEPPVATEVRN
jgi:predicted PurR-regulated permease PerM